jgi:hypothetical protein
MKAQKAADQAKRARFDQPDAGYPHGVHFAVQIALPEIQEPSQDGIDRGEIKFLPYEFL